MNYQTTDTERGAFPTIEWFKKLSKYVEFKGKTVFDAGCAEGMMSLLSLRQEAKYVFAVDEQKEMVKKAKELLKDYTNFSVFNMRLQSLLLQPCDISIFSMIIHWIGEKETKRLAKSNIVIFIFREANVGYDHPANGVWFPTRDELNQFMMGYKNLHTEELMEQDSSKKIVLSIYVKV